MGFHPIDLIEELLPDTSSIWLALHPTLTGCNATGRTQADAIANLDRARQAWLAVALEQGLDIPEPEEEPRVLVSYLPRAGVSQRTQTEGDSNLVEMVREAAA